MPEENQPLPTSISPTLGKPKRNWKKILPLLLIGLFLISLVGVGLYLLIPKPTEGPTAQPPTKQATPSAKPKPKSKIVAYCWNDEIWITDVKGQKQKIHKFEKSKEEQPLGKCDLNLFVSTDNRYVFWTHEKSIPGGDTWEDPNTGEVKPVYTYGEWQIYRYDLLKKKLKKIITLGEEAAWGVDFAHDENKVYYIKTLRKGNTYESSGKFVSVDLDASSQEEISIPREYRNFALSPNKERLFLSMGYSGGPISKPIHAVIKADGLELTKLPYSFERYGVFTRLWSYNSESILQTKDSTELVSFDVKTGKEKTAVEPISKNHIIDDCGYIKSTLYCKIRDTSDIKNQISRWYKVTAKGFKPSGFNIPKVSDKDGFINDAGLYYENESYYSAKKHTFDDSNLDYKSLWFVDRNKSKKKIIEKFREISLPLKHSLSGVYDLYQ